MTNSSKHVLELNVVIKSIYKRRDKMQVEGLRLRRPAGSLVWLRLVVDRSLKSIERAASGHAMFMTSLFWPCTLSFFDRMASTCRGIWYPKKRVKRTSHAAASDARANRYLVPNHFGTLPLIHPFGTSQT